MKKKTIIKVSQLVLIPTIFILLIIFTNNKLSRCGRDPYNFLPETELAKAVYWCEYEKAKKLISQGADINSKEGDDVTSLHLIAYKLNILSNFDNKNCLNIFKLLLQSGADVNAQDSSGKTPLWYTDNMVVMDLLLKSNADPNIKNNKGQTPLFYYMHFSNESYSFHCIKLLLKHGARVDIKDNQGNTPLSLATGKTLELLKRYEKRQ